MKNKEVITIYLSKAAQIRGFENRLSGFKKKRDSLIAKLGNCQLELQNIENKLKDLKKEL